MSHGYKLEYTGARSAYYKRSGIISSDKDTLVKIHFLINGTPRVAWEKYIKASAQEDFDISTTLSDGEMMEMQISSDDCDANITLQKGDKEII